MVAVMLGPGGSSPDGGRVMSNGLMGGGTLLTGTSLGGTLLVCAPPGGLLSNGFTGVGTLLIGISVDEGGALLGAVMSKGPLEGVITLGGITRFSRSKIGAGAAMTKATQRPIRRMATFILKIDT